MKEDQGAVDESSLEQQFCKLDTITIVVGQIWSHMFSTSGSMMAVWQASWQAVW